MNITIDAYAKINLHLDVTKIRDDGYHDIQSIMQSVSLCDVVEIETLDEQKIVIECDVDGVPLDERNIAYKAAKAFFDESGISCGAIIKIKKNIPMAAGLAGGSADGAAVLVGLNKLFEGVISEDSLYILGASLGADIPFCMRCGCCYTSGIGDKLVSIKSLSSKTVLVIACGGEGVSTPTAYGMLDNKYDNFHNYTPKDYKTLVECIEDENKSFYEYLFNIFEEPIAELRPTVEQIKTLMLDNGANRAMMSGSGPSVFGVFDDIDSAQNAVKAIEQSGSFATIASPIENRKI